MRTTRITITHVVYPRRETDLNEELQCLGAALGLFSPRDKDKSRFRIFIALIKALRTKGRGLTSDELAAQLDLTRATVIHHLDGLMDAGIVDSNRGIYQLRVDSLEDLVEQIKEDVSKTLDDLQDVARHCDAELGLGRRPPHGRSRTPV